MNDVVDIPEYPRCECGYVVAESDPVRVDGKALCLLCTERICPKSAHAADCTCRVCDSRAISRKHAERVKTFLAMRPMRRWPTGGIR